MAGRTARADRDRHDCVRGAARGRAGLRLAVGVTLGVRVGLAKRAAVGDPAPDGDTGTQPEPERDPGADPATRPYGDAAADPRGIDPAAALADAPVGCRNEGGL